MLRETDQFYLKQEEPVKSCLLALREIILALDDRVSEAWKYRMPFFCYSGKMFCYLRMDTHTQEPYIGLVEGKRLDYSFLEQGNRKRMKIWRIDPNNDLPVETLEEVLNEALDFYRDGIIKLPARKGR